MYSTCIIKTIQVHHNQNKEYEKENKYNSRSVKALPDGFHSVTPYLIAKGATELIEFITNAFDGHVLHSYLKEKMIWSFILQC